MNALYLIVHIAGERIAIPAEAVESVVELEGLTPVPGAPAHVLGLSALRSRVLTVIDCRTALGLGAADRSRREAMVVNVGGHPYALLVDHVEDVVEKDGSVDPVSTVVGPCWARAARGVVTVENSVFLLIDPAVLVEGPASAAA